MQISPIFKKFNNYLREILKKDSGKEVRGQGKTIFYYGFWKLVFGNKPMELRVNIKTNHSFG
jgi:hypothetical protein